jgi:hypothetical protein
MFSEETIQGEFLELIEDIGLAVFGYPLVLIGIICLICSCFSYAKRRKFKNDCVNASGVVVELKEVHSSEGANTFTPVVEFSLPSGEVRKFTKPNSQYPATHSVGQEVDVYYLPNNPDEAVLATDIVNYAGFLNFFLTGSGTMLIGVGALYYAYS